ncbi:hypothetical protein I4F81_006787 [Pyropia yezoensis]|uniref:Uncharacterized protein n=1 Tax=Pyropia yezoensis TaxID=2788 RepID=A0ACC3C352_PYRYE|nr:hypothetical protein I4F81_006787 [Neopyropia yezoensis]
MGAATAEQAAAATVLPTAGACAGNAKTTAMTTGTAAQPAAAVVAVVRSAAAASSHSRGGWVGGRTPLGGCITPVGSATPQQRRPGMANLMVPAAGCKGGVLRRSSAFAPPWTHRGSKSAGP